MGFSVTSRDLEYATFEEFEEALAGALPDTTETDRDNFMLILWARIMMKRFGITP